MALLDQTPQTLYRPEASEFSCLVKTGEGRAFTICKHNWLFACLAHSEQLLDGLDGESVCSRTQAETRIGGVRTSKVGMDGAGARLIRANDGVSSCPLQP